MSDNKNLLDLYKGRRILIAPLNWGLGHATRCMPLIKALHRDNQVSIASDGLALDWLRKELGSAYSYHLLPSYNVKYDQSNAWVNLLRYGPVIKSAIAKECKKTASIIKKEGIDLIISDHRLGVRASAIESIIIAHQLRIPHQNQFISGMTSKVQQHYMNQFDSCWIPDYEDVAVRLSGTMSDPDLKIDKKYIGPLSHMRSIANDLDSQKFSKHTYDVAVILSGLEPARNVLEEKLVTVLSQMKDMKVACVRGTTLSNEKSGYSNITYYDMLSSREVSEIIKSSAIIISRAGYSTIMDLHQLNKKVVLIPTPHQPEQAYLAKLHSAKDWSLALLEEDISVEKLQNGLIQLLELSK